MEVDVSILVDFILVVMFLVQFCRLVAKQGRVKR
jgi:hypothetical protein